MYEFGIGGNEAPRESNEGISNIPQNRTLLIQKLTSDPVARPEVVQGLTNVEDVFAHFKPQAEVEFTDAEGGNIQEELSFNNLGDFGKKGITAQSQFLNDLQIQQDEYQKFIKTLRSNKILNKLLADPEAKAAYLESLKAAIAEIEASE